MEKGAIVAAGALVTPGKIVPSGQIWAGTPAKFLRELEEGEADFILQSANNYAALASVHAAENSKTTEEILVRPKPYNLNPKPECAPDPLGPDDEMR